MIQPTLGYKIREYHDHDIAEKLCRLSMLFRRDLAENFSESPYSVDIAKFLQLITRLCVMACTGGESRLSLTLVLLSLNITSPFESQPTRQNEALKMFDQEVIM